MSEQHRGAWGDAMWWPGVVAAPAPEQQQLQPPQQHPAGLEAVSSGAQTAHQQLFTYKMASSFQNPATTPSARPAAGYDYRLGGGNGAPPQNQWWYPPATMDNSMHVMQNHQQTQQQNMTPVQTPPPPQQSEAQARQEDVQRQQEAHRHHQQEAQRQQQEAQRQHQEAHRQHQEAQRQHQEAQRQQAEAQQAAIQQHQQALAEAQARHQQLQQQQQQYQQQQLQQQQQNNHQQHQQVTTVLAPNSIKGRMPRGKGDSRPRGRMTAYAFFVQTCREEHKKKHPEENVVFAEFSKKCAERWKTMLDKEKKRFHEMAENDKKRFDDEMKNYTPPKGEKQRGKKRKQIKDPNAPKRSLSAFFWFSNDERGKVKGQNPEYGVGDIAKELGRRWADAEPEVKSKYEALADKDKARYEKEMTAYKKKNNPSMQPAAPPAPVVPENDDIDDDDEDNDDDEDE